MRIYWVVYAKKHSDLFKKKQHSIDYEIDFKWNRRPLATKKEKREKNWLDDYNNCLDVKDSLETSSKKVLQTQNPEIQKHSRKLAQKLL